MATRLQDVQASITRTEEVAKLQQAQHQAPQVNQEQLAANLQQEKQVKRHQAQEAQGKDQSKVRDEDIPSRQRRYLTRKKALKNRKAGEEKKAASGNERTRTGNRIDLKV